VLERLHLLLASELHYGEWSSSRAGRFIPVVISPCINWTNIQLIINSQSDFLSLNCSTCSRGLSLLQFLQFYSIFLLNSKNYRFYILFIFVNPLQTINAQFLRCASYATVLAISIDTSYGCKCNSCTNDRHTVVWGTWVSIDSCRVDLRRIRSKSVTFIYHRIDTCQFSSHNTQNKKSYKKSLCHTWIDGPRAGSSMIFRTKLSRYACSRLRCFESKYKPIPGYRKTSPLSSRHTGALVTALCDVDNFKLTTFLSAVSHTRLEVNCRAFQNR
jgi:hypothetical protein